MLILCSGPSHAEETPRSKAATNVAPSPVVLPPAGVAEVAKTPTTTPTAAPGDTLTSDESVVTASDSVPTPEDILVSKIAESHTVKDEDESPTATFGVDLQREDLPFIIKGPAKLVKQLRIVAARKQWDINDQLDASERFLEDVADNLFPPQGLVR